MKKILISALVLFGAVALTYQAAPVMAAAPFTVNATNTSVGDTANMTDITLSPNVSLSYDSETEGSSYQMKGKNSKGPMGYGVDSDDTAIYQMSGDVSDTLPDAKDDTTLADDGNGWTEMGTK